ncbi:MAG: lysine--tRNA ligase [Microgenomates group bacterium]
MIWVNREVNKIKKRRLFLEWVDDMKTPSGRIHVGALRGVVIHDLVYKVLIENGIKAKYTYVFDDHDPMDAIPAYLDYSKWEKYAGMQLYQIPSPDGKAKNYAQFYAQEFIEVFNSINCHPEIIWASQLYKNGKMNEVIKEILDATSKIREIYQRITKKARPADWHPFNVVCEKCKKVGTTYVYKWDGQYVYYRCQPKMVAWATGCGFEGKISPFNGNGKLPWKIEWAAKWKVIGVTIEGAGKDHMSAGGSHDIASTVCREVLNYPVPYPVSYEWFTVGGRKMSSSKGVGSSAKEVAQILPPDIFRFFIVRTPIERHIDFNPYGEAILNIFDDYDRCLSAYFLKIENKIPPGKQGEVVLDFARIIELSQVKPLPQKRVFLPRFRTIANLLKNKSDVYSFFNFKNLSKLEKEILEERVKYAKVYLENYAQEKAIGQIDSNQQQFSLNDNQKKFLKLLAEKLDKIKTDDRKIIQQTVFNSIKETEINPKDAFAAFYQILTSKSYGPKAADLILEIGRINVVKKLKKML